jgi:tetrathionate reductase subunit B
MMNGLQQRNTPPELKEFPRRDFIKKALCAVAAMLVPRTLVASEELKDAPVWVLANGYQPADHYYAMGIDTRKCIGCGRCVEACKTENNVPREPMYFRTWVERYRITAEGETIVDSPNGAIDSFKDEPIEADVLRTFFVPKLCNHCDNPPCVQVCPVGATYKSPDGVVLVDSSYCIGCRYCIQACPYGARFLHPVTKTAEKCTFCYHRISAGLPSACVQACPFGARQIGDIKDADDPVTKAISNERVGVLKAEYGTKPQVFYVGLDWEVR